MFGKSTPIGLIISGSFFHVICFRGGIDIMKDTIPMVFRDELYLDSQPKCHE